MALAQRAPQHTTLALPSPLSTRIEELDKNVAELRLLLGRIESSINPAPCNPSDEPPRPGGIINNISEIQAKVTESIQIAMRIRDLLDPRE